MCDELKIILAVLGAAVIIIAAILLGIHLDRCNEIEMVERGYHWVPKCEGQYVPLKVVED